MIYSRSHGILRLNSLEIGHEVESTIRLEGIIGPQPISGSAILISELGARPS